MNKLEKKLKKLPKTPGVYLYRDNKCRVIYVGKAVNLRNRVFSYFHREIVDPKTVKLVEQIVDLEYIECGSEIEALLLESELIKRYKPKYNIDWKDDKNYCYIRITNELYPRVMVVHQTTDPESRYFGPFVDNTAVKKSLRVLRRIFPYCNCSLPKDKVCLYYHIGLCRGHGESFITSKEYKTIIASLIEFLTGKKDKIIKKLKKEMTIQAKAKNFEQAAKLRDQIISLEKVRDTRLENQREASLDTALLELKSVLNLKSIPNRIECYDISNIGGKFAVGSMVVFEYGLPQRNDYRRFEIKTIKEANDYAMLTEVLERRFGQLSTGHDGSFQKTPDLVVIDGGKGQLSVATKNLSEIKLNTIFIGLAKKKEEIYSLSKTGFVKTILPETSEARFLLQRVRDEAHRFAITYHRNIRSRKQTESALDSITSIGPKRRRLLIKKFGTIENIRSAKLSDIGSVVGEKLALKIKEEL